MNTAARTHANRGLRVRKPVAGIGTMLLSLFLGAATLASAHAQNLVVNGTFPVASTDGWEEVGASGGYVNEPFSAQGGVGDWINLTGTLAQNLNTVPGQWYVLSFATTGYNPSHGSQAVRLRVFWGSQVLGLYIMPNSPPWQYPRFLLRADTNITRLTFEGFDYPNLDDVVVSPATGAEPRIQISQPAQNALFTAYSDMTLAATVQLAPNRTARQVEFFHSGIQRLGASSAAPYTFNWSRVPPGQYVISARVTDSSGATITSTGVTVFVEARPSVRIRRPLSGTAFTNGDTIAMHGTVLNNDGAINRVEFSAEGNTLQSFAGIPSNLVHDVSTVWSNVPEGNFTLSLTGLDAQSQSITHTSVTVHVMPPGALGVNQPYHDLNVRVGGQFEYGQTFVSTANGRLRQIDVIGKAIAFWDVPTLRAAIVEMASGSPGTVLGTSELASWRIDPIAWANYSIYFPSNRVYLHAGRTYAVLFSCPSDTPGMQLGMQPDDIYPSGTLLQKNSVRGWAPPIRILPYPVGAQFDLAFSTYMIPNASPNVRIVSPEPGAVLTAGSAVDIQAEASDDDGVARLELLRNGAVIAEFAAPPFTVSWDNVPPGIYTLQARVTDAAGYTNASPITTVEVRPNAPPEFYIEADLTVPEDSGPVELVAWATSISPGASHEFTQALQFVAENDNPALFSTPPAISPSGALSFVPAPNAHGSALVRVQLMDDGGTAFNGSDTSAVQTFVITVAPVNDRPIAQSSSTTSHEDVATEITLNGLDPEGEPLTVLLLSQPQHGALSGNAALWSYKPASNFFGTDTFSFAVSDGELQSEPATITIEVLPVNDPPTVVVRVEPLIHLFGEEFVVSLNGVDAPVLLDASASSDIDNNSLQFSWFAGLETSPFATGPLVTNRFPVGPHDVRILVSDSVASVARTFRVEVITLADTVEGLIATVEVSPLPRQRQRPLIATLKAAAAAFERQNYGAALNQLQAFENKINAQVVPIAPDLGEVWRAVVAQIALLAGEAF